MIRIESIEDDLNGVVTYEFQNGKRVRLDAHVVREYGLADVLRRMGLADLVPDQRIAVMRHGRKIGTVPPAFDPYLIKSKSWLYDPRPGDFRREGDVWIASNTLGPGDLEAVPGFVFDAAD